MKRFLEAGRLGAPRGIKGEVRFECWCDSPEFLGDVTRLYLDADGARYLEIAQYRPTIPSIIFKGYEDRTTASSLTNRTVYFDRSDITLPEGVCFNDDLIGLKVFRADNGDCVGVLTGIEEGVRNEFYIVKGEKTYRIPNVEQYIIKKSLAEGIIISDPEGLEA